MQQTNKNIVEVFKDSFEDFLADVPAGTWNKIQAKISSSAIGSSVSSGSVGFFTSIPFIAGSCLLVGIVVTLLVTNLIDEKSVDSSNDVIVNPGDNVENSLPIPDNSTILNDVIKRNEKEFTPTQSVDLNDPLLQNHKNKKVNDENIQTPIKFSKNGESIVDNGPMSISSINHNNASSTVTEENCNVVVPDNNFPNDIHENTVVATTPLQLSISADHYGGFAPLPIHFSSNTSADYIEWDFGDGQTSNDFNPDHAYQKAGDYLVVAHVIFSGITASEILHISVEASSFLGEIPNIFTPNNDGYNDILLVHSKNLEYCNMRIVDMQGNTVFESNSTEISWDGKNRFGIDMPTGTYICYISAKGRDGKIYQKSPAILLKRH